MKQKFFILIAIAALSVLVQATAKEDNKYQRRSVAILIFDGVQVIDFAGPYEVFGQAGYDVFTVAKTGNKITTNMNLDVVPKYDFRNHPEISILVVPGGRVPHSLPKNDSLVRWITEIGRSADYVLSVCNGAFLLTSAGLLDGKDATTYAPMIGHLTANAPEVNAVYDKRFVQSGNIITSGGLSAGIDAALYLVSVDKGMGRAREVANNMEYDWHPNSSYARSKLADMRLQSVLDFYPPLFNRSVIKYEGDSAMWVCEYEVIREEPLSEFFKQFEESAFAQGWKKLNERVPTDSILTEWEFADFDSVKWKCSTRFSASDPYGKLKLFIHLYKTESNDG